MCVFIIAFIFGICCHLDVATQNFTSSILSYETISLLDHTPQRFHYTVSLLRTQLTDQGNVNTSDRMCMILIQFNKNHLKRLQAQDLQLNVMLSVLVCQIY
jgi:hypothetical protein